MPGTAKRTLSDFYAVRSICSFITACPARNPTPNNKTRGQLKSQPRANRKTSSNSANERSGEHASAQLVETSLIHRKFPGEHPDENPDDAPPHEPSAQPAPRSHASYANDALNQP